MNNAVMNKIDLLLESYLEEGPHFGSARLDKRFAQGWPNSADVRAARSAAAQSTLRSQKKVEELMAKGKVKQANLQSNTDAAFHAHDASAEKEYKRQYHMDPKDRIYSYTLDRLLEKNPRMISVSGGPGKDPSTPINPIMAAKAGLYDNNLVPRDPEKSILKFW